MILLQSSQSGERFLRSCPDVILLPLTGDGENRGQVQWEGVIGGAFLH